MGVLVWLLVAIIVAVASRVLWRYVPGDRPAPSMAAAILGGILGGFVHDLILRGDSVMNFRGPTVIGAVVGAVLLLVVAALIGWTGRRTPQGG